MFFLISSGQNRPSVLEKNKDAKYHIDFARYCVGQANNVFQNDFVTKVDLNKRFYKGDQWIKAEDLDMFLKDENDQSRNRIKMKINVIKPIVEQFRGNAIRMSINFKVKSISPQAINRRETKLAEMLHFTKIANDPNNPWGDKIKKQKAVGDSEEETSAIFENLYVDKYVEKINYLSEYVSSRNEFQELQKDLAEEMCFSGIGILKTFEYSGHQQFELVKSENFFFDRSALKSDLSDAEFMGEVSYLSTSEIFEKYPDLKEHQKTAIENYAIQFKKTITENHSSNASLSRQLNHSGKVPVYSVYWRDSENYEYGYVKDEFGYEYLTKINYTYEGDESPRYTDKDLIQSKSERAKRLLGGKLKKRICVDTLRVSDFIPQEIVSTGTDSSFQEKQQDLLLQYGIVPYQETENLDFESVKFPYKVNCWAYVDGEILSPIDDVIDPQRFINRLVSITENHVNNSRGSGTIIDGTMVDDQAQVLSDMNQSKPIFIDAKGRGIQNAVGSYDTSIKQGTMVMFNIIDAMKKYVQDTTGINEAIKGESTGSDQLVGVTQLMIQRGSLMQEPFYNAITNIFKQCYQSIATVGKRIYADNERNICIAVGDEGHEVLKITRDMKLEDFRSFVKRQNSDEQLVEAGTQKIMELFQLGLLDEKRFANLYGRANPDQVAAALRQSAKEKEEIQRAQSKAQAAALEEEQSKLDAQEQEQMAIAENAAFEQEAREDINKIEDRKHEINKEAVKGVTKIAQNNPEAQKKLLKLTENLDNQTL